MTATDASAPPVRDGWDEALRGLREARRLLEQAAEPLCGGAVGGVDDGLLMEMHAELATGKQSYDLMLASTSGEIGRRSEPQHGQSGLARKHGFKSPADMLAHQTGGSKREAHTLIDAGRAMADAKEQERKELEAQMAGTPPPEPEEPVYPVVARALSERRIGVESASAITRMLDSVRAEVPRPAVEQAERQLVAKAPGLTADQFRVVVRRHQAWLQADAADKKQQVMARSRYLVLKEQSDGCVEVRGLLDPESAAPLRAALDGMVKEAFRQRRDGDPTVEDTRTPGQIRADALVTFARHMLGCEQVPTRATTTIAIHMDLEGLRSGVGAAEVDGGDGVIPAGRLRRLAVDAEYLPVVLGGNSEVLDVGRKQRFFSDAQRAALLVRDGGCAMCGAPPSHCEAHHIDFWRNGGVSDIANGVMLCVACHHIVHGGDWGIDASMDDVWFIPPASIDPSRKPRLGGRARYGVSAQERKKLAGMADGTGPPGEAECVGDGEPPGGGVVGEPAPTGTAEPGPVPSDESLF